MARVTYEMTVAPTERPVSVPDLHAQLRIDDNEEDQLLWGMIDAATNWAQDYCWSQFCTATWKMRTDYFWCTEIPLHPNPVSDVTAIDYTDTGGNAQSLTETTEWISDVNHWPALVYPAYEKQWPTARGFRNDVTVTMTCGYGAASAVPQAIKQAILMLVGNWYEHRTAAGCDMTEIPFGVRPLLDNYSYRALR